MEIIKLRDEYIKLGQALKAAGLAESGVDAKNEKNTGTDIQNGEKDTEKNAYMYKRLICGNARRKGNRTSETDT